ncbi:hypothetical protein GE115_09760 [Agromyces sp. CFH 90414]|uniref:Lipoprotein n=1 Tax=Agromyces agglutinans TaxID=2662258 RepID=A0A6I2F635_9MICO|nr:hypothetical protein [Agromyces agglutinans]MRG60152.1 hypothetical protein [Agromyces agglutinans]
MASTSIRRAVLASVALASVFVLAACAPPKSVAETFPGEPVIEHAVEEDEEAAEESEEHAVEGETSAVWLGQGGQFAVTTWGSSTCPVVGTDLRVLEPAGQGNAVEIITKQYPDDQVCTMDLVPYTSVFWTPMNIAPTEVFTVHIDGTEIEVPVK